MKTDSTVWERHPPNTSEGLSSSSSFPPLLVSYVANPPSGFLILRSCMEKENRYLQTEPSYTVLHLPAGYSPHWQHHTVALRELAGWWRDRAPAATSPTSGPQLCSQPRSSHSHGYWRGTLPVQNQPSALKMDVHACNHFPNSVLWWSVPKCLLCFTLFICL